MTQSFRKDKRVVHRAEFTRIIRNGNCAADDTLVIFALATVEDDNSRDRDSRLGVTIPVKTGNAVTRNRWKRLIRESFRIQQDSIPRGFDFVVRPKKDAAANWTNIRRSLPRLAKRAVKRVGKS